MTTEEKLKYAANVAKGKVKNNSSLNERANILRAALKEQGFEALNDYEEKPHTGASFQVRKMSDHYRINIRCGYGKHNYAPVLFIKA